MNLDRLEMITDGDPEIKKELLDMFFNTSDKCLNEIKNNDKCDEAIHELKGAANNLGFRTIGEICASLENSECNKEDAIKSILSSVTELKNL